jgi:DNA-binding CsgD family transcriptional regulator
VLKRIKNYEDSILEIRPNHVVLSDREYEFLELVCDERELTYDQMAEMMNLSIKTVESYRTAIFERFNIKSKVGLVLFSYKYQLTKPFR